uniref:Uncharacterized protein n=1 Tax=Ornithorhynchus anatinus TaxID=9258 RepID=F6PL34_ORNAN
RCPLKTLQKCEIALEKLKNDMAVPTPPPPPVPPTKQQYLCQPLLDAVLANIRSPVFNHSLYRTFVPAMTAIHGPPITGSLPLAPHPSTRLSGRHHRVPSPADHHRGGGRGPGRLGPSPRPSPGSPTARPHSHPPVRVGPEPRGRPSHAPLPGVPRLSFSDTNPFLQSVHQYMTSKLLQLPDKHSVTALLNTWAQSIRQACLSAA